MRSSLAAFCLLTLSGFFAVMGGTALAEEQESRMRQIMNPKPTAFNLQTLKKSSTGQKTFNGSSAATIKEFFFPKKFSSKDFLTGAYAGNKACWMGDFKYNSVAANTSVGHSLPNAGTKYGTKTADTKEAATKTAYDSEKKYGSKDFGVRDFRGKEQKKIDQMARGDLPTQWEGALEPMTVEQVRALLNKSK